MSEAQQMWDAAVAIARAFHNDPIVQAYYKEEARRNRIKQEAEEAAAKAKRDAEIEEKRRSKAYDAYVLDGGGDPCFQAGHRGHCGSTDCSLYDPDTHSCPYASAEDFGFPAEQSA